MCGIVGYTGKKEALPVLIGGLKALEYRGYDSAGVAILSGGKINCKKTVGPVKNLEDAIDSAAFSGNIGIAHTRWATHGEPNEANSHPQKDCNEQIFVVHNGIIENHKELREYLSQRGHIFLSETDTEVIPHLIEDFISKGYDFKKALFSTIKMIRGAYALLIIDSKNPDTLYAVKLSSPLDIGKGEEENFIASNASAFVGKAEEVIHLEDRQIAEISKNTINVVDFENKQVDPEISHLQDDLEQARLGNFPHYMLKEIFEGPEVVKAACMGRLKVKENIVKLGGLEKVTDKLKNMPRIVIVACGTSYYAGLIAEYYFEEITRIPTEVHTASEFRYRKEPFDNGTVVIVISQSGETEDTKGALEKAKEHGLLTLGVVNVVGSTISRKTDAGVYNHAGPEIAVASTKAFLSQVTVLFLMAVYLSKNKETQHDLLLELEKIPEKISKILEQADEIEKLAKKYKNYKNFLFLGRLYNYPVALEGALKLKEISYLHAEGYGAGEMKHGPIALIDQSFPTIALVPQNDVIEKMYSSIEEIGARKGPVIAIATEEDKHISSIANDVFYVPKTLGPLEPLLMVVPLQLFAYYVALELGRNVDRPRNLAKSVTVE